VLNQDPARVRNITCIGAGPIGGGWAAHFLAQGYQVTSYLHDASEYDALMRLLETAWASLEQIGLADNASRQIASCSLVAINPGISFFITNGDLPQTL